MLGTVRARPYCPAPLRKPKDPLVLWLEAARERGCQERDPDLERHDFTDEPHHRPEVSAVYDRLDLVNNNRPDLLVVCVDPAYASVSSISPLTVDIVHHSPEHRWGEKSLCHHNDQPRIVHKPRIR